MWALIKAARKAHKQWRNLGAEDGERLREEADRVRHLVLELGGRRAATILDESSDGVEEQSDEREVPTTGRPRSEVSAELTAAIAALSRACTDPGRKVIADSTPRSLKIGGRIVKSAAKRAAPMIEQRVRGTVAVRRPKKRDVGEVDSTGPDVGEPAAGTDLSADSSR